MSVTGSGGSQQTQQSQQPEQHVGWTGLHYQLTQFNNMRDLILLDSDSTDTIFCNEKYVSNIRASNKTLCLNTNGGVMESNMICNVPKLGTFWFNKKGITNIIALAHMTQKYCVTLDTNKEKALIAHLPQ